VLARLARFDGADHRFAGPMTVAVFNAGTQVEWLELREVMSAPPADA